MGLQPFSTWLEGWFAPKERGLLCLRQGQLLHVIDTGKSALLSSLGTLLALGAIALQWSPWRDVAAFVGAGTGLTIIAHFLYLKAQARSASAEHYVAANAYYMAHSVFIVAAMAVVGLVWVPGNLPANIFVMLVVVVCATVRASYQAAHLPSAALSISYFAVGIGLCLWEGTQVYLLLCLLGVVIALMLAEINWRMHKTVEAMLKLGQSERALLAEQQRLVGQLRDANDAKSQFMARMSHELRTPLNAVIGFSEVMAQESMGKLGAPLYLDYAKSINAAGGHLLQLINDILDMSKLEAGRYTLREGTVDPWEAVEDAIAMVRLRAEEGGVRLVNAMPRGCLLRADEMAVRQIAINLASNAVKFTPRGGEVRWGGAMNRDGGFALGVVDTGCGIPADEIEFVFEPFGQSASGYHARERGTGLGLPIVRSLMTLHGGTAAIKSAVGQGTVVTITFPAQRVQSEPMRAAA